MKRKGLVYLLTIWMIGTILASCSLPVEEIRAAKTRQDDDRAEFRLVKADYGDIVSYDTVSVTGLPQQDAVLSFGVPKGADYEYAGLYAAAGDEVAEGQILAALESPELDRRIQEEEEHLEALRENFSFQERRHAIEKRRQEIQNAGLPYAERIAAAAKLEEDFQASQLLITDDIEFSEARLSRLLEEKKQYVITAPFDGTVLSAVLPATGETYRGGQELFRVAEIGQPVFQGTVRNPGLFDEESSYTITLDRTEAEVRYVNAEKFGLPRLAGDGSGEYNVCFLLTENVEFSYSKRYAVRYETAKREQVLTVPTSSVYHANDEDYVYMLDEQGLRMIRKVECGARDEKRTEIISGLSEGEEVLSD